MALSLRSFLPPNPGRFYLTHPTPGRALFAVTTALLWSLPARSFFLRMEADWPLTARLDEHRLTNDPFQARSLLSYGAAWISPNVRALLHLSS